MANTEQFVSQLIESISAANTLQPHLLSSKLQKKIERYEDIYLIGVGKAAYQQVSEIYKILSPWREKIKKDLILTKYNHSKQAFSQDSTIMETGHPVCDHNSQKAGEELLQFVSAIPKDALLIFAISGGASAIAVIPHKPFTLKTKIELFEQLLNGGATIDEMNKLRSEISQIKNGALLNHCQASEVVTLVTSDVPLPELALVGSGPTIFQENLEPELRSLANKILSGETKNLYLSLLDNRPAKPTIRSKTTNICIADGMILLKNAQDILEKSGSKNIELLTPLSNEIIGDGIAKHLQELKKLITSYPNWTMLSGGELTVKVSGKGMGGRNTEYVLQMCKNIFQENQLQLQEQQLQKIQILSLATDGSDGPTDCAGAWIDYERYQKSISLKLDINHYLQNNDSYNFFKEIDSLIMTGPTGTNLMDLRLITLQ